VTLLIHSAAQAQGSAGFDGQQAAQVAVDNQLNIGYTFADFRKVTGMDADFGKLLRDRRRKRGISQRELAEAVGVDFSYISKLENGRLSPPSAETISRMCQALGIPDAELLAAARKIPTDVGQSVASSPAAVQFLHSAAAMQLSEGEWEKMRHQLKRLRG